VPGPGRSTGSLTAVPLRLLVAVVAGVALALAFEPVRLVWLLPVAMAALLWCVRGARARAGLGLGYAFGAAFFVAHLVWMRAVGTDAWLALALYQALYVGLAGAGLAAVSRLRAWPLWSAAVWVGVEAFRGAWPFEGLTWGRLGFAVLDSPFEAWLPWAGVHGAGFAVVLVGGLLLWTLLGVRARPRHAAAALGLVALALGVPWVAQPEHRSEGETTVAVVQGNVPGRGDDLVSHHREVTRSHVELTRQLAEEVEAGVEPRPDLVLWPENSTAVDPFTDSQAREGISAAVDAVGVPLLVGGMVDAAEPGKVLNQGIVVDPVTGPGERYTKRHPVPFGEFIPFRSVIGNWSSERLGLIPRDMIAGNDRDPLDIDGVRVADLICFDVSYDDVVVDQVRRGGELVVVQTSNALFIHTGQIEQQFAISRVRARETGRTLVVASVNGLSGVVDHRGDVVATIRPRTADVLVHEVPLTVGHPPSLVVGPWLGRACVVGGLVASAWGLLPYRRRRAEQGEDGGDL
jgi:apolipoprotein N-acyltransferase